jgi:FkbM family methyltransferase
MTAGTWVQSLGLDVDGDLYVEIDSGIRIYDSCLKDRLPGEVKLRPEDLMRLEHRRLYYRFLSTLKEIETVVIQSGYEKGHVFHEGQVVVDAGARVGAFAMKISRAVGEDGRVLAIEPEPRSFALLMKNIRANGIRNIVAVQKALWSEPEELNLFLSGNGASHSIYPGPFYGSTGDSIRVQASTLDDILKGHEMASVDFIKMDIEGSEIEALKGMKRALGSRVHLAIAAYHPVEGSLAHERILPHLEQLGFEASLADGIVHARRSRTRN